jgi:hypothetical protein
MIGLIGELSMTSSEDWRYDVTAVTMWAAVITACDRSWASRCDQRMAKLAEKSRDPPPRLGHMTKHA